MLFSLDSILFQRRCKLFTSIALISAQHTQTHTQLIYIMQHHNHFNDSTISEILRSFIRYSNEAKDEAYTENTVYIIDTDKTVYVWPGLAWPVRIHE